MNSLFAPIVSYRQCRACNQVKPIKDISITENVKSAIGEKMMDKLKKIFREKEIIKIKNYHAPPNHTPMTDIIFPVSVSITKKELKSCNVEKLKKVVILRGNFYLQARFE